jgi:hypothetical protein
LTNWRGPICRLRVCQISRACLDCLYQTIKWPIDLLAHLMLSQPVHLPLMVNVRHVLDPMRGSTRDTQQQASGKQQRVPAWNKSRELRHDFADLC